MRQQVVTPRAEVAVGWGWFFGILNHALCDWRVDVSRPYPLIFAAHEKEIDVGYFIDLLLLFVRRPAEGLRRIRERPSILAALIALLLTGVIDAMSFRLLDVVGLLESAGLTSQMTDALTQAQQAPGTFWAFVTEPFFLVMLSVVIIDAVAQLAWKRTAAPHMYVALSFSGLVGATLRVVGILLIGVAGGLVLDIFAYGAVLYVLVVGVMAVRLYYEKSTARALAVYLLPTLLGVGVLVLLTLTVGGAI